MRNENDESIFDIIRTLCSIDYIAPEDIPSIELYMDQVTTFMDQHLADSKRSPEDKILTKTMINNYTKNNLLPPPTKKKYSKDHMYLLIFIYYLKNLLSINDIQSIIAPMTELFYQSDATTSLEDIYKGIFELEEKHSPYVIQDFLRHFKESKVAFPTSDNEEEASFLERFSLICMLSYDVYMKKSLIERIIDETFRDKESGEGSKNAKPVKPPKAPKTTK